MVVLGVDPGLERTGYAFISVVARKWQLLDAGIVRTQSGQQFPERLKTIYDGLSSLIEVHQPNELAVENLFYSQNPRAAIEMGHVRGVVILTAVLHAIPVIEYAARVIKKAVVGHGNASKQQVQKMVKELLHLEQLPKPYDMADAIAIALCHILRTK